MRRHVDSETGRLKTVLMAAMKDFVFHEPMNEVQRRYYAVDPPRPERLHAQHRALAEVLAAAGVAIVWVEQRTDTLHQIFVRDIATVILDTLVVCEMRQPLRRNEPKALAWLVDSVEGPVESLTEGFLEAGDVMVHGGTLYVGQSLRTDARALSWLERRFAGRLEIAPLALVEPHIHLDVVFNIAGKNLALIYPAAFEPAALARLRSQFAASRSTGRSSFLLPQTSCPCRRRSSSPLRTRGGSMACCVRRG